jgi:oxygen-dependent protoporphyrinogen oxidase
MSIENKVDNIDYDVAIVGGGITGLAAAWYIQQQAADEQRPLRYALLEQADRWGGKICTEHVDGPRSTPFVVEAGPDSFITQKPWALQLSRELGLDDQLLPTNEHQRQVYVLNRGRPTPLPDGVLLIVPTKFMPFATSRLISIPGKLRMGMDLFIPAKRDGEDETLSDFIQRRLGREALDKIAEPLLSGIYNAEADRQSVLATFPRLRALEEKYGSLTRGMLAARTARGSSANGASKGQASGQRLSTFVSFEDGLETMVDALQSKLTGDCRLETGVDSIEQNEDGSYRLMLSDGTEIQTQSVLLTTPSFISADLLANLAPAAVEKLRKIRYVSTGTISFAYQRADMQHELDGYGLVVPRSEERAINAVTWTSTKFAKRAPDDHVLLRAFFGGSRSPQSMDLDDDALVATVRKELREMLGIDATPIFHRIYRWIDANPQYDVGHNDLVDEIEAALPSGLFVCGSPYRGVGIPDCVHQAEQAVAAISTHVAERQRQEA